MMSTKRVLMSAVAIAAMGCAAVIGQDAIARRQVLAQSAASGPVANPVTTAVKSNLARYEKNMVAAADLMPADKFSYKPTADMITFGHLTMHIAQSNNFLCSKISGQTAPEVKLTETDPKDTLVSALKASFEFCNSALAGVDDSKLGDPFTVFNRQTSRAGLLISLSDDWYDHYSAQAVYLRLNGILPPTAHPKK